MKDVGVGLIVGASLASSFKSVVGRTVTEIGRVGDEIERVDAQRLTIGKFNRLRADVDKAKHALAEAEAKAADLRREIARSKEPTDKQREALGRAQKAINQAREALVRKRRAVADVRREMSASGIAVNNLAAENDRLGRSADQLRARMERLKSVEQARNANLERRSALRGQLFDAVALGAALVQPVSLAREFESAMADVRKNVNGLETAGDVQRLGSAIKELAVNSPMGATGIAAMVAEGGKIGLVADDALEFARSAELVAAAWELAPQQAGNTIAKFRTSLGLSADATVDLADAINYLGDNSGSNAQRIASIVGRAGAIGLNAGFSATEVAALASALDEGAPSAEIAATSLKNVVVALTSGEAASGPAKKAFNDIGYGAVEMAEMMQRDAKGMILKFFRSLKEQPKEVQTALLTQIAGRESLGAIAPLLGNLENLERAFGRVADQATYAGSVQAEYANKTATADHQIALFQSRIGVLGETIGRVLLPPLNLILKGVGAVAVAVADVADEFPILTSVVVGAVAGAMGLTVAATALGYAWTFVVGGILRVKGAFLVLRGLALGATVATWAARLGALATGVIPAVITGVRALGVAVAANPIGAVLLALTVGATLVITHWEEVKSFFAAIWEPVRPYWEAFLDFAGGVADALSRPFRVVLGPLGAVVGVLSAVFEPLASRWSGVGDMASSVAEGIRAPITGLAGLLRGPIDVLGAIFEPIKPLWEAFAEWVKPVVGAILEPIEAVSNIFKEGDALDRLTDKVGDKVGSLWDDLTGDDGDKAQGSEGAVRPGPRGRVAGAPVAPVVSIPPPARLAPAESGSRSTVVNNRITVNAAPGQSVEEIAEAVARMLSDRSGDLFDPVGAT